MNVTFPWLSLFIFFLQPQAAQQVLQEKHPRGAGSHHHVLLPWGYTHFSGCIPQSLVLPGRCSHMVGTPPPPPSPHDLDQAFGQTRGPVPPCHAPPPRTLGVMSWVMQNSRCCRMLSMVW